MPMMRTSQSALPANRYSMWPIWSGWNRPWITAKPTLGVFMLNLLNLEKTSSCLPRHYDCLDNAHLANGVANSFASDAAFLDAPEGDMRGIELRSFHQIDCAYPQFFCDPHKIIIASGHHAGLKPEGRGIGKLNCVVNIAYPHHGRNRPEGFTNHQLARPRNPVEYCGSHGCCISLSPNHQNSTLLHGLRTPVFHALGGFLINQSSHIGGGIEDVAQLELARRFGQQGNEAVCDLLHDQDSLDAPAGLASVGKSAGSSQRS